MSKRRPDSRLTGHARTRLLGERIHAQGVGEDAVDLGSRIGEQLGIGEFRDHGRVGHLEAIESVTSWNRP